MKKAFGIYRRLWKYYSRGLEQPEESRAYALHVDGIVFHRLRDGSTGIDAHVTGVDRTGERDRVVGLVGGHRVRTSPGSVVAVIAGKYVVLKQIAARVFLVPYGFDLLVDGERPSVKCDVSIECLGGLRLSMKSGAILRRVAWPTACCYLFCRRRTLRTGSCRVWQREYR